MKSISKTFAAILFWLFTISVSCAQIYAPEGLNMPGNWDNWMNPPENPAFAGAAQAGGQLTMVPLGNPVYQTTFQCANDGDVAAGDYSFKFTSGPIDNIWQNQWGSVNAITNTLQEYTYGTISGTTPENNSITLTDNRWYVMNWDNTGYADTRAIFMELSSQPAAISAVTQQPLVVAAGETVEITVETNRNPAPESYFYVRYTTDGWTTTGLLPVSFTATTGTATLPGMDENTEVAYYVFSTIEENPSTDIDLKTLRFDNNNGNNFGYTVGETISCGSDLTLLATNPVFPLENQGVVVTFNAALGNGGLAGYDGDVYAHTGVITSESTSPSDWKYVKTEWGENTPETKMTRINADVYELTIDDINNYYGVPAGETIEQLAFVFRSDEPVNGDNYLEGKAAGNQDIFAEVYANTLQVKITYPTERSPLVDPTQLLPVCASSLNATSMNLYVDDNWVMEETTSQLTYGLDPSQYSEGTHWLIVEAADANTTKTDSTLIFIRGEATVAQLPAGVQPGINYLDDQSATLVLHDPAGKKEFAFVIGDFNNWSVAEDGYMNVTPDDHYFWITLTGLTPGTEYAYQYYIDGELKIADPYTDKVLDPYNDQWIPEETYPELKAYPFDKTIGNVSVLETGQTDYDWQVENFTPVAVNETQSDLVIYELLVRDFVEDRRIKSVTDSLDYLQELGVNAIELMPFNEFEGNDSWGYNPSFYFAPDKAYGTKADYKAFIDACHEKGIAVIMDLVLNHSFSQSPMVQMYWNETLQRPSADNPWYNETAPHPFSPGYDFNHESQATRDFSKRVMTYWMEEYKVDGFRFDLSKGFTQTYTGDDVAAWGQYDQSRVDIWNDYYSHIKSVNPNAYVILEHFAENNEEVTLANSGILLWGKATEAFSQNTMGYSSNADYSWAYYTERGYSYPNLVSYMESHDEERLMYSNLEYGNASGGYDIADLTTALERMKAVYPMYFAVPGPKMIWQFSELGYDYSINYCPDGTVSEDCRTAAKPVRWDYRNDFERQELYQVVAAMAELKQTAEAFQAGTFTKDLSSLTKKAWISHSSMNICVGANFNLTTQTVAPNFQHTGTWYNYFTGETLEVADGETISLEPGDYYVFTDQPVERPYLKLTVRVENQGLPVEGVTIDLGRYGSRTTDSNGSGDFALKTNTTYTYRILDGNTSLDDGTISTEIEDKIVVIEIGEVGLAEYGDVFTRFYPNPASDQLYVETKSAGELTLSGIDGKTAMQQSLVKGRQKLDIQNLKPGIYLIRFETAGHTETGKIVVK
jgi:1,4-alpha-glucan branching enzyme